MSSEPNTQHCRCGRALTDDEREYYDNTCERCEVMEHLGPTEAVLAEIGAERRRQVQAEGWTPEHDDQHTAGELAKAAACYAATGAIPAETLPAGVQGMMTRTWPWSREWWKPQGGRHDLVRAAALIVAELERLDRAQPQEPGSGG